MINWDLEKTRTAGAVTMRDAFADVVAASRAARRRRLWLQRMEAEAKKSPDQRGGAGRG